MLYVTEIVQAHLHLLSLQLFSFELHLYLPEFSAGISCTVYSSRYQRNLQICVEFSVSRAEKKKQNRENAESWIFSV